MKITKIESIHAGQFLFVRIHTDAGIHGVGEGGVWAVSYTHLRAHETF